MPPSLETASLRDLLDTSRPGPPLVESVETAVWDEFAATRRAEPGQSIAFAGTLPSRLPAVAQACLSAAEGTDVRVWLASHCAATPTRQSGLVKSIAMSHDTGPLGSK